jgi:adenylosuccinate synthase
LRFRSPARGSVSDCETASGTPPLLSFNEQHVNTRRAILVVDLAFGDCGKGTLVDFLVRHTGARTVVRFNGGPQAGHNVVTTDGRRHTFSQFGSGTFVPGVKTFLSRFMLIEPYALFNEAAHLQQLGIADAFDRLMIDSRCLVITPAHQIANRLRELARGSAAHGTCGMGVGETMQDLLAYPEMMLRAADLCDREKVDRHLRQICRLKQSELATALPSLDTIPQAAGPLRDLEHPTWIDTAVKTYHQLGRRVQIWSPDDAARQLSQPDTLVFEGAQGVLLDEHHGFHPHTTWSTTTFDNAQVLLSEMRYQGRQTRIGVLRTYFTRHGAGPFVTEEPALASKLPEPHNTAAGWQGQFRIGIFDAVAARYALAAAGPVDCLAITHLDRLHALPPRICDEYETAEGRLSNLAGSALRVDSALVGSALRTECVFAAQPVRSAPVESAPRTESAGIAESARSADPAELTQLVKRCKPVFTSIYEPGTESFLNVICQALSAPIGIVSFGPTAQDKRILQPDLF